MCERLDKRTNRRLGAITSRRIRTNVTVPAFRLFFFIDRVRTSLLRSVSGKEVIFKFVWKQWFSFREVSVLETLILQADWKSFLVYLCKEFTGGGVCIQASRRLGGEARWAAVPPPPAHPVLIILKCVNVGKSRAKFTPCSVFLWFVYLHWLCI